MLFKSLLLSIIISTSSLGDTMYKGWAAPTSLEIGIHVASQGLLIADMLQTLDIKHHPNLKESNFILGETPSDGAILGYFLGTVIVSTAIWYVLPPVVRDLLVDGPIIYFELPIVINNAGSVGLKFRF